MFVARVCLGSQPFTSKQHLRGNKMAPVIRGRLARHTSVVGEAGQHREFIVYDGTQAFPEYIVKFVRQQ